MGAPGRFDSTLVGPDLNSIYYLTVNGGALATAMSTLNNGWAARFIATDAKDVKSVRLYWSAVSASMRFTVRIETIDATTGKPTGTLYDASAEATGQTPTSGLQTITFGVLPTTNLTAGTMYAVVVLTTTAGATTNIASYIDGAVVTNRYPINALWAADGTTRSNFAEITAAPICSLVLDDDTENPMGMVPFAALGTSRNIFGTAGVAQKITFTNTMGTWTVDGVAFFLGRTGTPAGDLRIRIFTSADATVSNSTITLDKDALTGVATRRCFAYFGTSPTLTAGTYRIVFDSASSADSSNCWTLRGATALATGAIGQYAESTCADVGTPSWSDTAGTALPVSLLLNDISVSASGVIGVIGG